MMLTAADFDENPPAVAFAVIEYLPVGTLDQVTGKVGPAELDPRLVVPLKYSTVLPTVALAVSDIFAPLLKLAPLAGLVMATLGALPEAGEAMI